MKIITFILVAVVLTTGVATVKSTAQQVKNDEKSLQAHIIASQRLSLQNVQKRQEAVKQAEIQPEQALARQITCREAIEQVFPLALRDSAKIVLVNENRNEDPNAIGGMNGDGSQDFGCMQINNSAHPKFFATQNWQDPIANVTIALEIYNGRQAQTGNGWEAWYSVEGVLW